jgi:hypothetical protein
MSESTRTVLRVVRLPSDKDGKPLPNACAHLGVFDASGKCLLGSRRMTRRALERAEGGDKVLLERARKGRLSAFLSYLELGGKKPPL